MVIDLRSNLSSKEMNCSCSMLIEPYEIYSVSPKATFHENYVRNGTIYEEGENGILLNEDAIQILVETTIEKLKELSIRQAKSYMYVDEMTVDFNDSSKMMRIKHDSSQIVEQKDGDYAVYFYSN